MFILKTILLFFLFKTAAIAASPEIIEEQIRLCDTEEKILKKLDLSIEAKPRDVLYLETYNQFYNKSGWVIRIKVKKNEATIDLKKRMAVHESIPELNNIECEFDEHDQQIEKTCKISHDLPIRELNRTITINIHWEKILSPEQKKWLESKSSIRPDAHFLGTLKNLRYEITHQSLGVITLDLTHLQSNRSVNYHEISIRYFANESQKSKLFREFIEKKDLYMCPDQTEWSVNKFDVLARINSL